MDLKRAFLFISMLTIFLQVPAHSQPTFELLHHPIKLNDSRAWSNMIAGDDGHIFVITRDGYIYRSTNNGYTWYAMESPFEGYEVYNAAGSHDGLIVVATDKKNSLDGNIWLSTDNGLSWGSFGNLSINDGITSTHIWIKPNSVTLQQHHIMPIPTIYRTSTNLSGNWVNRQAGKYLLSDGSELRIGFDAEAIDCYDVCSWLERVMPNGQLFWYSPIEEAEFDYDNPIFGVSGIAPVSNTRWLIGTTWGIYITEDAGQTWVVHPQFEFQNIINLTRIPTGEIFLIKNDEVFSNNIKSQGFMSLDDGETWTEILLESGEAFGYGNRDPFVASSNRYVYVYKPNNQSQFIIRSSEPFGQESILEAESEPSVRLHSNYPNPFNPSTLISFELNQPEAVTLEIYDIQGRLVDRLLAGKSFESGTHHVQWNALNLSSGVYIYRLRTNTIVQSRKMILVR
jgi:hypothetical protein